MVLKMKKTGSGTPVRATAGVKNCTTELQFAGTWMKILGYNPLQYLGV